MSKIYKITNSIDGSIYVGKTTTTLDLRFKRHLKSVRCGSDSKLHRLIRTYGKENFRIVLIEDVVADLDEREIFYINLLRPELNMTYGGEGGSTTHGKKWITDGTLNKYITAGGDIPDGWRLGRTCKFTDPVFQTEMSARADPKKRGESIALAWKEGRIKRDSSKCGLKGDLNPAKRPEVRAKISASRMGQIPSKESSQKSADSRRGKKRGPYKRISTE